MLAVTCRLAQIWNIKLAEKIVYNHWLKWGRQEDLATRKNDISLRPLGRSEFHFQGEINPYVYRNWRHTLFCYMAFQLRMKIFYFHFCCLSYVQPSAYGLSYKFYQLLLKYFKVAFCILKSILFLWMWNVKLNHKAFYIVFFKTKNN